MIYFNNKISNVYLGDVEIIQVNCGNTEIYKKGDEPQPTSEYAYEVGTYYSFEKQAPFAYDLDSSKWFALNNQDNYEPYGVYANNQDSAYEGKLAVVGTSEYEFSNGSWRYLGEVEGGEGTAFTISRETTEELRGQYFPTSFKIKKEQIQEPWFNISVMGENGDMRIMLFDYSNEYRISDYSFGDYFGTVEDDGEYYIFSCDDYAAVSPNGYKIGNIDWWYSYSIDIIASTMVRPKDYKKLTFELHDGVYYPSEKDIEEKGYNVIYNIGGKLVMNGERTSENPYVTIEFSSSESISFDKIYKVYDENWNELKENYSVGKNYVINSESHVIGVNAFYNKYNITSVTIPNYISKIGSYAFQSCSGFTSVNFPTSINEIGINAFYQCNSLTSITYEGSVEDAMKVFYPEVFNSDNGLVLHCTDGDIPMFKYIQKYSNGNVTSSNTINKTNLVEVIVTDTVADVPSYAFSGCTALRSVTFGENVKTVGQYAFRGCSNLTTIISKPNKAPTIYNYTFSGCPNNYYSAVFVNCEGDYSSWKSNAMINKRTFGCIGETSQILYTTTDGNIATPQGMSPISNTYEDGQGIMTFEVPINSIFGDAFSANTTLETIELPNSVTFIGYGAFQYCTNLTSINIPSGVTYISDRAFSSCTKITSTIIIPDSVTTIGGGAFNGCARITSVSIGSSVTSIGNSAFAGCSSLTSVTIGSGVTSIGYNVFATCGALTSVVIPNSVTSIGYGIFQNCRGLTSITIPSSVTSIGSYFFSNCEKLTSVTYNGTKARWKAITKGNDWNRGVPSSCIVHCTDGECDLDGNPIVENDDL